MVDMLFLKQQCLSNYAYFLLVKPDVICQIQNRAETVFCGWYHSSTMPGFLAQESKTIERPQ